MKLFGKIASYTFSLSLSVGLVFASSVFGISLYAKATGREWLTAGKPVKLSPAEATPTPFLHEPLPSPTPEPVKKASAMLDAPIIRQHPELPAGCEVTSLAMLLQYYGVGKTKLDLADEMRLDQTALKRGSNGEIVSWGNPNLGYVGDIYGKARGFGIYHVALFPLLQTYVPSAIDLTGADFDKLERQVSAGFPAMVWTTIDFLVPANWLQWDTSIGPFRTTFSEHAVLLVGYDESAVYVNDPYSGKKAARIDKAVFTASWEAMGKQALTYTKKKE